MIKFSPLPSSERLHELFIYEPDTGLLRWRVDRNFHTRSGDIAGGINSQGYLVTRVDGKIVRVHRIAWKMMTGKDPKDELDHKNMVRTNNKWNNLREADKSQNCANRPVYKRSTSGLKGAFYNRERDRFYSQIKKGGKRYLLGYFDTAEEAHAAYMTKARELYGEYARAK